MTNKTNPEGVKLAIEREAVARIIEPDIWAARDLAFSGEPYTPWEVTVDQSLIGTSLAKADTILAALSAPLGAEDGCSLQATPFAPGGGLEQSSEDGKRSFQARLHDWVIACFGPRVGGDTIDRNHRFLEEALELVQANGCAEAEAYELVGYVYGRPQGDINQEVGGVMTTLAALCNTIGVDMAEAAETELARVWTKVEQIRAKDAAKPKFSPLPGPSAPPGSLDRSSEDGEASPTESAWVAYSKWRSDCDFLLDGESDGVPVTQWTSWYADDLSPERAALRYLKGAAQ